MRQHLPTRARRKKGDGMRTALLFSSIIMLAADVLTPVRADIIVNGGFEDGVYSSTINGSTNIAPTGWTPSYGWDQVPFWNSVGVLPPHSGSNSVMIGNGPGDPVATLSQTFLDTAGVSYQGSFYLSYIFPTGSFSALINGAVVTNVTLPPFATGISTYTKEFFTFVGTGLDTLTFSAFNDDFSYSLDDVTISPSRPVRGAPGPVAGAGLPFLVIGFGAYWFAKRRRIFSS